MALPAVCAPSDTVTTPPIAGLNAQKNGYVPGSSNVTVKLLRIGNAGGGNSSSSAAVPVSVIFYSVGAIVIGDSSSDVVVVIFMSIIDVAFVSGASPGGAPNAATSRTMPELTTCSVPSIV